MDAVTLRALEAFPRQLEEFFADVPTGFLGWKPASWEGIPSEPFSALEQLCHVRDIEVEGYHVRFERTLSEDRPMLPSVDGFALVETRSYATARPNEVIAAFRAARAKTVSLLRSLPPGAYERPAHFEGYGDVSLRSLVHFLCSHDQQHLAGLQWLLGQYAAPRR